MPANIRIKVEGIDKLIKAFEQFPAGAARAMYGGIREGIYGEILTTRGMQNYPPAGKQNAPPYPYYERGMGTHVSPATTYATSENLGKQWYTRRVGAGAEVGNRASYAPFVHGDEDQAEKMGGHGWRKLHEVAMEKRDKVGRIVQAHIIRLIRRLGL